MNMEILKRIRKRVDEGESWYSAGLAEVPNLSPAAVTEYAKSRGLLVKSKAQIAREEGRRNADEKFPEIQDRRGRGMTLHQALRGTGVTETQYYRALERSKWEDLG